MRVFVDAASGTILHVRDKVLHVDATDGYASPGVRSDIAANPATSQVIPGLRVVSLLGAEVFTAANGTYSLAGLPAGATLTASLSDGQWVGVTDSQTGTPSVHHGERGTGVIITLNPTPSEFTTSQVNAFIHQTMGEYLLQGSAAPSFSGLSVCVARG